MLSKTDYHTFQTKIFTGLTDLSSFVDGNVMSTKLTLYPNLVGRADLHI